MKPTDENTEYPLKLRIRQLEYELDNFDVTSEEYEEMFDESLDENGFVNVAGLLLDPSFILKQVSPTDYRNLLNQYADGMFRDNPFTHSRYKELHDELENLKEEYMSSEEKREFESLRDPFFSFIDRYFNS